jgi:hypothetical protein
MKTSNTILTSFAVNLFIGIFVLFTAAKIHSINEPKIIWTWQEKAISPFSVVVAEPGTEFNVQYDQSYRIGISFQKGDTCTFPPVEIRHDTLFVHPYVGKVKQQSVIVFGGRIKTIQGKENSTIWLKQFGGDTLVVKLKKAAFKFFPDNLHLIKFSLNIYANHSNINMGAANFDLLNVELNQTQLNSRSISMSRLSGILKDHSILEVSNTKSMKLESDSTSTCRLNN